METRDFNLDTVDPELEEERDAHVDTYELARHDSESKLGAFFTHDDGAQEIGFRALRQSVRLIIGKEVLSPESPKEKRVVLEHDDGSVDTGSRAIRNMLRLSMGKEPKIYKRTFKPLGD